MTPTQQIEPSTPEQRKPMYEDLAEILQYSFLAKSVVVGDVVICLRSLLPADYHLLKLRAGPYGSVLDWNFWHLATCIWMVDGQILLEDQQATSEMRSLCKSLPVSVQRELLHVARSLMKRANAAIDLVEAYCYENDSRFLWAGFQDEIHIRNGIPGTEKLGVSPVQQMWFAFNRHEDEREASLEAWARVKLLAATQSPKGIKKLNQADKNAFEEEKRRRQRVQDTTYYKVMHGIDLDVQGTGSMRFQEIRAAATEADLIEEMRKVRAGEKDQHDLIVDAWKQKVKERVEAEREARKRRVEEIQQRLDEEGAKEPSLRPLMMSSEEIEKRMSRGKTAQVYHGPKGDYLYDKYLATGTPVGSVHSKDGVPVPDNETRVPLQERVKNRKPTLQGGN